MCIVTGVPRTEPRAAHAAAAVVAFSVGRAQLARLVTGQEVPFDVGTAQELGVRAAALADGVGVGETGWFLDGREDARDGEPHERDEEEGDPRGVLFSVGAWGMVSFSVFARKWW